MLGIVLFCIGVMYTPGPVNILSLNRGMQQRYTAHAPFSLGVAVALCLSFLLVGYAGGAVVDGAVMPVITACGVGFILYLAVKIIRSDVQIREDGGRGGALKFRDGLFMQLLNPKALLVVLPVTTVQFPAAGITGSGIGLWSVGLGLLGFGAPFAYAALGSKVARRLDGVVNFRYFNWCMGLLLIAVALDMAYHNLYLALR